MFGIEVVMAMRVAPRACAAFAIGAAHDLLATSAQACFRLSMLSDLFVVNRATETCEHMIQPNLPGLALY